MSDGKRRDLERAAAAGDLEAEAQMLIERWRTGDLSEERLRFAAYLGHEPALRAGPDVRRPDDPTLWFERLGPLCFCVELSVGAVRICVCRRKSLSTDHPGP